MDRALPELLQELRVAQTGGQLFFAFLFSVAFMPKFDVLTDGQQVLYGWALFVVASATTVLVAPVAVHQWCFGHGLRPQLLAVTHVMAMVGLVLLAVGLILAIALVSSVVFPESAAVLPVASAALVALCWIVIGMWTRVRGTRWNVHDRR